jgi:hypothetical protein
MFPKLPAKSLQCSSGNADYWELRPHSGLLDLLSNPFGFRKRKTEMLRQRRTVQHNETCTKPIATAKVA